MIKNTKTLTPFHLLLANKAFLSEFPIISQQILFYDINHPFLPFSFMVLMLNTSGAKHQHQWCGLLNTLQNIVRTKPLRCQKKSQNTPPKQDRIDIKPSFLKETTILSVLKKCHSKKICYLSLADRNTYYYPIQADRFTCLYGKNCVNLHDYTFFKVTSNELLG